MASGDDTAARVLILSFVRRTDAIILACRQGLWEPWAGNCQRPPGQLRGGPVHIAICEFKVSAGCRS
jgi:hypothetical protein